MKTSNKKSKLIIPILIISAIAIIIAVVLFQNKSLINEKATATPEKVTEIPVRIATIEQKMPDNSISLAGSFAARRTLPLIAEAQGSVIALNIEEGQNIRAGQIVARIDPTSIQANLATAQATFDNAVKNKERYQRLVDAGAISQKQFEDVALNVESAKTNVKNIQQQMKYTVIHSPMSGIVSEVKVEKGSFATPGMQLGSVVDISRLKMVVKVAEADVIKLQKGQGVSIMTDVYPDQPFSGNISLISVQADASRKYDVEVEVMNSTKLPLKAGMFGTASFTEAPKGTNSVQQLFMPRQAIVGSVQQPQVFVLNPDSTVTLRSLEVQDQSGNEVIIVKGLNASEQVITSGQINLKNGSKVRVIK